MYSLLLLFDRDVRNSLSRFHYYVMNTERKGEREREKIFIYTLPVKYEKRSSSNKANIGHHDDDDDEQKKT